MYIEAYRVILTLPAVAVVTVLGVLGYFLGDMTGLMLGAGLPSILFAKFLYLQ